MLIKPTVTDLLKKAENRYQLATAISKRARQIIDGSKPMVKTEEKSAVTIASFEFEEGKLKVEKDSDLEEDKE